MLFGEVKVVSRRGVLLPAAGRWNCGCLVSCVTRNDDDGHCYETLGDPGPSPSAETVLKKPGCGGPPFSSPCTEPWPVSTSLEAPGNLPHSRRLACPKKCHGTSSPDLLCNGVGDGGSCCPATCSVLLTPSAQTHASFTSSRRSKNKRIPDNQPKTDAACSSRDDFPLAAHTLLLIS